jgi:hypothetical protein
MVTKTEAENVRLFVRARLFALEWANTRSKETYHYKVSLHDLRAELSTLRRTETASLQSTTGMIQRELDMLSLKFREDFNNLKSDLQIDMNNRKAELKEEKQKCELRIQDMNHRLSILASELKTDIETMKLNLFTKWSTGKRI